MNTNISDVLAEVNGDLTDFFLLKVKILFSTLLCIICNLYVVTKDSTLNEPTYWKLNIQHNTTEYKTSKHIELYFFKIVITVLEFKHHY